MSCTRPRTSAWTSGSTDFLGASLLTRSHGRAKAAYGRSFAFYQSSPTLVSLSLHLQGLPSEHSDSTQM